MNKERTNKKIAQEFYVSGPPFLGQNIHWGSAYNILLKEFYSVTNYTLYGKKLHAIRGWDIHGLPTDLKVQALLGWSKAEAYAAPVEFRNAAKDYIIDCKTRMTQQYNELKLIQPVGVEPMYSTDSLAHHELVWRIYSKLKRNNLITYKLYPRGHCTKCIAGLANVEIEKGPCTKTELYYRFKIDSTETAYIIIWTTTPWTIPGSTSIAYCPTETYAKYHNPIENVFYYISVNLPRPIRKLAKRENWKFVTSVPSTWFSTIAYTYNGELKHLYPADWVAASDNNIANNRSTGFVNIVPYHSENDLNYAKQYALKYTHIIYENGNYIQTHPFAGLNIHASTLILSRLGSDVLLTRQYVEEDDVCYRCSTPVISYAKYDYFLTITNAVKRAIVLQTQNTVWNYEGHKAEFIKWVEQAREWCISRDRLCGIPIPEVAGKVYTSIAELGVSDLCEYYALLPTLDTANKVFDCWFQSACAPLLLETESPYLIEGIDQKRGWVYCTSVLSMYTRTKLPFTKIHLHGFLLATKNTKLSKSKLGVNYTFSDDLNAVCKRWSLQGLKLHLLSLIDWSSVIFNVDNTLVYHKKWRIIENVLKYFTNSLQQQQIGNYVYEFYVLVNNIERELDELAKKGRKYVNQLCVKEYTQIMLDWLVNDLSRTYVKLLKIYDKGVPYPLKMYKYKQITQKIITLLAPYTINDYSTLQPYNTYVESIGYTLYRSVALTNIVYLPTYCYASLCSIDLAKINLYYTKTMQKRKDLGVNLKITLLDSDKYLNLNNTEKRFLFELANMLDAKKYTALDAEVSSIARLLNAQVKVNKSVSSITVLHPNIKINPKLRSAVLKYYNLRSIVLNIIHTEENNTKLVTLAPYTHVKYCIDN